MIEILKFIFSSFWIYVGTLILLSLVVSIPFTVLAFMAELVRPRRQDLPPSKSSHN